MEWEKVLKIDRPYGRRVLKFDSGFGLRVVEAAARQFIAPFPRKGVAPLGDGG